MKVTLTFDNGPDPTGTTAFVLDMLARYKFKATFFVTGNQLALKGSLQLAERAHSEGHWIGNHTLTHSVMFGDCEDREFIAREINETQALIGRLEHTDRLFRPFGGGGIIDARLLNPDAIDLLVAGRYTCVLWNCVPRDWQADPEWVDRCIEGIRLQEWAVVVMHDLPTGAMVHLSWLFDALQRINADVVQNFPLEITPIVRGTRTTDLAPITAARKLGS